MTREINQLFNDIYDLTPVEIQLPVPLPCIYKNQLSLALLVPWILANNAYHAVTANDLAVSATLFN